MPPASEIALVLAVSAAAVLACMVALWAVSVRIGDISIVDIFWGPGFAVVAWVAFALAQGVPVRQWLVAALTTIWALRLGAYLARRNLGKGEDPRYAAFKKHAKGNVHLFALRRVFLTQAAILWFVSLPVQFAMLWREPATLGWPAYAGIALFAVGFLFETVGDAQLAAFKADPAHKGRILDRGLWRYTRHPNYFGDACVWFGLFLIACDNPWGALTLLSPLAMTWFLVKVTGKALLERRMKRANPAYEDYIRRTSGFLPWFPKPATPERAPQ
jgi:steroid 5-alpha reductase family enzyme